MKKFLIAILLCIFSLGMIGCSKIEVPDTSAVIYGNGGLAVQKGDYLYFANGFISRDTITTENRKKSDYVCSALYVAKINSDNSLKLNDNEELEYAKKLVGNIIGNENTGLYIFGDYIYYTTPNTNLLKDGSDVAKTLINFCRIKLDGSNYQLITTSEADGNNMKYYYYQVENKVYLVLFDNSKLSVITIGSKPEGKTLISENVASVAFDKAPDNYNLTDKSYENIYYTASLTEDEQQEVISGNKLVALNAKTKETKIVAMDNSTYTVNSAKNGNLYINKSTTTLSQRFYKVSYTSIANENLEFIQLTGTTYTNIYVLDYETANGIDGILVKKSNNTMALLLSGNIDTEIEFMASAPTIVKLTEDFVYYIDANNTKSLKRQSIKKNASNEYVVETVHTDENNVKLEDKYLDITDRFVYMFVEGTNDNGTTTYLYRVNLQSKDAEENYVFEHVGVYAEGDEPAEEEET